MATDPAEAVNIATQHPDIIAEMEEILKKSHTDFAATSLFNEDGKKVDTPVITSYSIHYTKLYDKILGQRVQIPGNFRPDYPGRLYRLLNDSHELFTDAL